MLLTKTDFLVDRLYEEFIWEDDYKKMYLKSFLIKIIERRLITISSYRIDQIMDQPNALDYLYEVSNIETEFELIFDENMKKINQIGYNIRVNMKNTP